MKQTQDPNNDTLITRGVLLVGSGVLFAHVLFPFIWWNFMGGSSYYNNPQMIYGIPTNYRIVTYTPVLRATATVTATTMPKPTGRGESIFNRAERARSADSESHRQQNRLFWLLELLHRKHNDTPQPLSHPIT